MNKKIFIFNMTEELKNKMEAISCDMKAELIAVPLHMYNRTLSELCGKSEMQEVYEKYTGNEMSMEMAVMAGFTDKETDVFLAKCKKSEAIIRLKAVMTKNNNNWRIIDLYNELMKEYLFYKMRGK